MNEFALASLLASRVCHDLISPVGALVNGVEVLADEKDPGMREHAIALISRSAVQASVTLKLCRLAFGSMGSAGDELSLADARDQLAEFFADTKWSIDWRAPHMLIDKEKVKLAANLLWAARDFIPRGGVMRFTADEDVNGVRFTVHAQGPAPRITDEQRAALLGETPVEKIEGRYVPAYLAGLLAQRAGSALEISEDASGIALGVTLPLARPDAAAA